ncbi:Arm DNA-binding domain-containing protein, partial [Bacillus licheniformis]
MTVIKKDDKTGKYYFVYSGGVHPITGARIQKRRQGMSSLREAKEALKKVIIEVEKEKNSHNPNKSVFSTFA